MTETIREIREYNVPGMTCGHCVASVTEELLKLDSVVSVDADLQTKVVTVTGAQLNDVDIAAAIDEAGFEIANS